MKSLPFLRLTKYVALLGASVLSSAISFAAPTAELEVQGISPRTVAISTTDIYDVPSSGLEVVGVGQKVYLQALPTEGSTAVAFSWAITSRPSGSTAALSATTGEVVTLRPDVLGEFSITMIPFDAANQPGLASAVTVTANTYVGAGVFNTHATPEPRAPQCGTGFCHGGGNADPDLNVEPEWVQSHHAQKLQLHLSGQRGEHYDTSCLQCHTVGFDSDPAAVNGGFDDVATSINYDLTQIPALAQLSFLSQTDQFPQVPAPLQNLASIQCENCHGPGSAHPSHLQEPGKRIAGVNLDFKQCAQCHDSASGFQQGFYQWSSSSHPLTTEVAEGSVKTNTSCVKCHTGEGFIDVQVDGLDPSLVPDPHAITCSTCHDPHFSDNLHQLRVTGAFTFDSGQTFANPGLGGTCIRCHNSRVANVDTTATTSSRGAHHGPQGDMLLGINGASFGMGFTANSKHRDVVPDTCVHCHMAPPSQSGSGVTTPPPVGGHTFSMRDESTTPNELNVANACVECHDTLTSYDRTARGDYDGNGVKEGVQTELHGLFDLLRTGILATYAGTSIDPDTQKIAIGSSDFAKLTTDQKMALYNYNFVWEDGSFGVHNTSYAVQLLQRSYAGVYGHLITVDFPSITVRGPLVKTEVDETWMLYQ